MSRLVRQTERYFLKLLAFGIAVVMLILLALLTYAIYLRLVGPVAMP